MRIREDKCGAKDIGERIKGVQKGATTEPKKKKRKRREGEEDRVKSTVSKNPNGNRKGKRVFSLPSPGPNQSTRRAVGP